MAKKIKKIKVLSFAELCGKVVPIFTTQAQCASITELLDNHKQENTYLHTRTAVVKFKDSAQDTHSVSFAPAANGYVGTFSLGAVNQKTDAFSWTFKLPDGAIDHLQAGQTLIQTYNITLRDGANNTITTTVTVKIVGTNDAPVITSAVQAGTVTEVADGAQGENAITHTQSGAVTFVDVDTLDTHTAKVVPLGNNYIGNLAIGAVNQGADSIGWTFSVPDSVLDPLGPKDVRVQQYRVTVDDGHGGTASQIITITIRGANDGVTISDLTPAAQGGDVTVDEDDLPAGTDATKESLTSVGTFKISAPDGLDDLTVDGKPVITNGVFTALTFNTPLGNTLKITAFNAATGVVTYSYTLNGAETHASGAGENALFEKFGVVLTDKDGSSATASLDVGVIDDVPSIRVTGPGASLIVDETNLGINASASFASSFVGQYGADGSNAAGTSYALGVSAAGADSGLTDVASGQPILLYMDGNDVVGRVGSGAGVVAFRLSVDVAGNVTLDQVRALAHELNLGPDESVSISANLVSLTASITDADGDTASASIDLGASSIFKDDAPTISVTAAAADIIVVDETNLSTDASATLASLFTASNGADGAGPITYALTVSTPGADSGLDDSATGDSILLFLEGGNVVGRVGSAVGEISFRVTVNASGTVTLDQQRAILHTPDTGPDQEVSLSAGLISLVGTVTDGDGDTASASVNIGQTLSFRDDAPTAGNASAQLDDDALPHGNAGGTGDDADAINTSGVLTHDFGADGGSIAFLTGGAPTGFSYEYSGANLLVKQGVFTVLTLTLNQATGAYTISQNAPIRHIAGNDENNQSFTIGYRVTDSDGDTADGTLSIDVDDDTPTVSISGPVAANENGAAIDGVYQFSAGADGMQSGQLVVNVDGLNQQVFTSAQIADGETIVTSAGTLTISAPNADGGGTWTFTPSSVAATATVNIQTTLIDADGDSVVGTHAIQVANVDQPLVITGAVTGIVEEEHGLADGIDDETSGPPDLDTDAGGNFALTTNAHQGSFGPLVTGGVDGTLSFAIAALAGNPAVQTLADGALTSGGRQVYFALDGGNLIGYTNGDGGNGSFGAGDTKVFQLALTSTSTGAYTFTLLAPVDHPAGATAVENAIAIDLNGRVTVTDSGGPSADANVPLNASITVIDDVPVADGETASVVEGEGTDFNCAFVLDFSGSIDNAELNQMLQAVATAAQHLFDGTSGDVQVRLVPFSGSASAFGPFTTFAALSAQLSAFNPLAGGSRPFDGNTDFTAAIQTTMASYTPLPGWSNQVFFLSDGNPNEQTGPGGSSLLAGTATAWNTFVNGVNPVNVTTIGIGNGINTARLQDVDVDGTGSPISVANFSDLIEALTGVVLGSDLSGNVLDNDAFGADGAGRITSIEINGATYSFNGTQITSSAGGAPVAGSLLSNVTTEIGGKLTFNFATGAWHFTAPIGLTSDVVGTFNYTIVDRDGDTSSASLQITVQNANEAPVNTVPTSIAVAEDTPTKLTGISFADTDIGAANLTVTLSIPGGSGSLAAASVAGVIVGGTSSALTLTGTLAAINAFLASPAQGVTFTPIANSSVDVTLTVTSNDGGATGAGGALGDTDTVLLDISPVNDAPVATIAAAGYAATEQTNLALHGTGLSVFDVDAGSNAILVRLSVTEGVLNISAGNSGASVSGSGSSTVTITGSQAQINNLLGGIDTGPGSAGTINYFIDDNTPPSGATLTLFVDDTGDTGAGTALTHSASVNIAITAVNDAPVAANDIIVTNVALGTSFDIPKWALLLNDSDPDSSIDITAINGSSGLSNPQLSASKVTLSDTGNDGGSFVYVVSDGSQTRTATVTVEYDSNTMNGSNNSEIFIGNNSGTTINANGGNDILIGNGGSDTLNGGSGNDIFVFSTALNGQTNVDTIQDFDANPTGGQDLIYLDRSIFTALSAGSLSAAEFVANTSGNATNASQHIIFETDTGALFYDADGNGAGAKLQFATLTLNGISGGGAAVDHTDFFIV